MAATKSKTVLSNNLLRRSFLYFLSFVGSDFGGFVGLGNFGAVKLRSSNTILLASVLLLLLVSLISKKINSLECEVQYGKIFNYNFNAYPWCDWRSFFGNAMWKFKAGNIE